MKAEAKQTAKQEEWRSKYLDSVSKLESETQRFKDLEASLKRLTGRLCIATKGLSPRLDAEIKKLQAVIKRDASKDELEQLLTPLTDAIHALDDHGSPPVEVAADVPASVVATAPAAFDDVPVRSILSALITELKRDAALMSQADALDAKIADTLDPDALAPLLGDLSEMLGKRIQRLERARQEAEALLGQMVTRLDEISKYVADQSHNQQQALASSESFNAQLTGEMQAMGAGVDAASDLQQIRTQVRSRLDNIGKHLQQFRQRETERANDMRAKTEQMQARVTQLEAQAQKLQSQLQAEQQVALVDALTKVPNRLAYDKRLAEELQRLNRFGQPTCLAAWDVDHFKKINDTWGHAAGDRVLQAVAELLNKRTRSTDFFGRYGGEEFVMILPGSDVSSALKILDEVRIALSNMGLHFKGTPVPVTSSCGVTQLKPDDTATSAFERADKALYQAKQQGRNCCVSG